MEPADIEAELEQVRAERATRLEIQAMHADYNLHADLSAIRQALRRWAERHMIIENGHRYHALAPDQVGRPP